MHILRKAEGFEKYSQNGGKVGYFPLESNKQLIKSSLLENESRYVNLYNQVLPKFYSRERSWRRGYGGNMYTHEKLFFSFSFFVLRFDPPFFPPFFSLSLPLLPFLLPFMYTHIKCFFLFFFAIWSPIFSSFLSPSLSLFPPFFFFCLFLCISYAGPFEPRLIGIDGAALRMYNGKPNIFCS